MHIRHLHMILSFFLIRLRHPLFFFFFFNDTATTEIYTLSLHDALPICWNGASLPHQTFHLTGPGCQSWDSEDRKSTRLNSSHLVISYAVFCLKKKKNNKYHIEVLVSRHTVHTNSQHHLLSLY